MSADERVTVKTSVPEYQKRVWVNHAEALDMSQSEFVRTMVQSGRRGFELEASEPRSPDANPGGSDLEDRVVELLRDADSIEFEEIVDTVTEDIESRIDGILQALDDQGRVSYSNIDGYSLVE